MSFSPRSLEDSLRNEGDEVREENCRDLGHTTPQVTAEDLLHERRDGPDDVVRGQVKEEGKDYGVEGQRLRWGGDERKRGVRIK